MIQPINWSPGVSLEEVERQVIAMAYNFYGGNKTTTSIALGISVRTLDTKLEKYEQDKRGIARKGFERKSAREAFLARQRGMSFTPTTEEEIERTRVSAEKRRADRQTYLDRSRGIKATEAQSNLVHKSHAGIPVESITNSSAESPVPLSEREEVQSLSSPKAPARGNKRKG